MREACKTQNANNNRTLQLTNYGIQIKFERTKIILNHYLSLYLRRAQGKTPNKTAKLILAACRVG